ncbi:MAG: hypothetical protein K6U04_16265, partial [Armatimonadetes bacterium]|nr:hypothetical protein [Armatimonadota bacterium]
MGDQEVFDHDVPFANTLSTAQINQVAIAYMLALNQGTEDHPLGFICLDDVSSAFDLQNLAADAHLIRMLAYGNKGGQQRQVFIIEERINALEQAQLEALAEKILEITT